MEGFTACLPSIANSALVRLGKRGEKPKNTAEKSPEERHQAMTWMQRLKRVFSIDMEVCEHCGGKVKVIACIEDPTVIALILSHLKQKQQTAQQALVTLLPERGPPQGPGFRHSPTTPER